MINDSDVLEKYCDEMKFFCWEGETGIKQIHELCRDLGYKENQYQHGDSLHEFLRDNSGAFEALLNWIGENMTDEWVKGLSFEDSDEDDEIEDIEDMSR